MNGDGGKGDGGLFAGGKQHVHFAFWGLLRRAADAFGEADEAVGDAAHSGDNDDDLIALTAAFGNAAGDVFDALGVGNGGAAIFLNDESHCFEGAGNEGCRLNAEGFHQGGGVGRDDFGFFAGNGERAVGIFEAVSGHGRGDKAAFGDAGIVNALNEAG